MNLSSVSSLAAHWPTDWIIVSALVILIAFDAYRSGSGRATALALALPLTLVLTNTLPAAFLLGSVTEQFSAPSAQAVIFGVVFIALFLMLYRIVYSFSGGGEIGPAFLCGMSATAVVMAVWLQVPGLQSLYHFGPQVESIFGELYRFWWFVAAYFMLAMARG
jgi:hypothetical protein